MAKCWRKFRYKWVW